MSNYTRITIYTLIIIQDPNVPLKLNRYETSHDIIEKVTETRPSAIIMDNWIPTIGGIKATQILKKHNQFKHIPVIYCSANKDVALLAEKAGAEAYLAKPFDLTDLENTVEKLVRNEDLTSYFT